MIGYVVLDAVLLAVTGALAGLAAEKKRWGWAVVLGAIAASWVAWLVHDLIELLS